MLKVGFTAVETAGCVCVGGEGGETHMTSDRFSCLTRMKGGRVQEVVALHAEKEAKTLFPGSPAMFTFVRFPPA